MIRLLRLCDFGCFLEEPLPRNGAKPGNSTLEQHRSESCRAVEAHYPTVVFALAIASMLFLPSVNETATAQTLSTPHQIPIEHLYWHFLIHQYQVDQSAAKLQANGKDATWMRNHLQQGVGFSDADYAFVRISAARLSGELAALNQRAAALQASNVLSLSSSEFKLLSQQRTADINAEVAYLKANLSPEKITALETYMQQFFIHSGQGVQK